MGHLEELAERYQVMERVDKHPFQRKARIHQSKWREDKGFPIGEYKGRKIGNYLGMPWAKENLANFLDDTIKATVRREVQDPIQAKGKLFSKPRIYDNLLSSQPLAFNLFSHLAADLDLATTVLARMSGQVIAKVTGIEFEHSPGRGDPRYTGDRSAFDVYVRFKDPDGRDAFAGIEVKYHEDLAAQASDHDARYDEIAAKMRCFRNDRLADLQRNPLQQIWRDHLLAGIHAIEDKMPTGFFAILAPSANIACQDAISDYHGCLCQTTSFQSWSLEGLVSLLRKTGAGDWVELFHSRYLDLDWLNVPG